MLKLCIFAAIVGASFGKLTVILVLKRTIKAWTTTIHLIQSLIPNPIMCPSLLKLFLNSFLCEENKIRKVYNSMVHYILDIIKNC